MSNIAVDIQNIGKTFIIGKKQNNSLRESLVSLFKSKESKIENFRALNNVSLSVKRGEAIGIIGRLVPIKNHLFFIDVIEKTLLKTNKKLRFFIIGDGEEKENLIKYVKSKDIDFSTSKTTATVQFTSWIKDIDVANAGMDIICLCSKNEGTPVSLIEAQASSKPIVSTKTGGIENIVMENETALLSENGDESKFINNLIKLIESSQLRKQLTILSQQKSDEYSYKNLINNIKELYKQ